MEKLLKILLILLLVILILFVAYLLFDFIVRWRFAQTILEVAAAN